MMAQSATKNSPSNICIEAAVIGVVMMAAAVYKLWGFLDYSYYMFMFQHLPEQWVQARYCVSIGLRLVTLLVAFGVIRCQEFYRKAAIVIAAANIVLTYFKHPFEVFYHIAVLAESGFPRPYPVITGHEMLNYPYYPWMSMMMHIMVDMGFSLLIIFYLTRPSIKSKFS